MNSRRVVVTGMGALTPIGNNVNEFWNNAVAGVSGSAPITRFDTTHFNTKFGCEIKGFSVEDVLTKNEIKRSDLFTQYALVVVEEALKDSQLNLEKQDPYRIGMFWGTGQGGMLTLEEELRNFQPGQAPRFNPFMLPKYLANMAAGTVALKYGIKGINHTTISACSSGNSAIMDAYHYIILGKADVIIAGGSDTGITEASVGGFNALRALSTKNADPTTASRPFDVNRDGFVIGEGAGAIILEEYHHALNRGATIYAEVIGAEMTNDAYHLTATHPNGEGAIRAMTQLLENAGIRAEEVDYLNAHATSTPVGDISEIKAIKTVFGENSKRLHISATKSMTGHLLGASGAIEAVLSVKSIQNNQIPPTINTETIDPEIPKELNIVIGKAKATPIEIALSNTFGFGGHSAIVGFRKVR